MYYDRDEYLLLSRGGRVPRARSKGPPYEPPHEPQRVVVSRLRRRKSLLDPVLRAVSMTRALVIGNQEQRRSR